MLNQLLVFILYLTQNVIIVIYLNSVFDYKYSRKFTNIMLFISLNLLFLATTPIINLKVLKLSIIAIMQVLIFKFFSRNSWWETIKKNFILIFLVMTTEIMADSVYYFICKIYNTRLDVDNAALFDTLRVLLASSNTSLFMSVILIYTLNYQRILKPIKKKLIIILTLIPIMMFFIHFILYSYNISTFTKTTLIFIVISDFIFTALSLVIYGLMLKVEVYAKREHELEFLKQKEKMQLEYYKNMQNKEEEIRKINHDIKNNLQVIYSLNSEEDKSKLIKRIDNDLKKYELIKYSKNDIQNIILNMKVSEAKNKGIDIEISLKNSLDFLDDLDISNLFSNILDNAIESASKSNEKIIKFQIYKKMNYIIVKCSNTFDGLILVDSTNQIKTKKNDSHGFGLKIIDSIVKKYNGDKKITFDDNLFTISIMIPVS